MSSLILASTPQNNAATSRRLTGYHGPREVGSRPRRGIDLLHTGEFSTPSPEEEPTHEALSPADDTGRHLAISCPHHQAAGLQRTREITPSPHDLLRKPIEGAAREAQGQTHRVRAAIGSGEDTPPASCRSPVRRTREKHRFHWLALHRGPDGKSTRR